MNEQDLSGSAERALPDHFTFTSTLSALIDSCFATSSGDLRDVLSVPYQASPVRKMLQHRASLTLLNNFVAIFKIV
jgi:hypothetical protein